MTLTKKVVPMLAPDFEKTLSLLLKYTRDKFTRERSAIESILRGLNWYLDDEEIECRCAAADSSFLVIESRIGYLYVIQGVAALYDIENGVARRSSMRTFFDAGLINIRFVKENYIIKKSMYKKVLTEYAYALELENLLEVIKGRPCDIALVDGSFISFAMSRRFGGYDISIEGVKHTYSFNEVEEIKNRSLTELSRFKYTVFLAKSSNAGFYSQGAYPDMYVLELARIYRIEPYFRQGFLEPLVLDTKKTLYRLIKESLLAIDTFTVTYVRFRQGLPVYQLSFPYKADLNNVKHVYSCLKKWSASGYPMPLEYAHRLSKIPKKHLINTMTFLGIPIASGRELIEIS